MKLALIILAFLTAPAFAQPACMPAELGGTGKGLQSKAFASGVCRAGWWCPMDDGRWAPYTHCTLAEYVLPVLPLPIAASSPAAAVLAAIETGRVTPPPERAAAFTALHAGMRAALQATRPEDVMWVVDVATSADGTRPAYTLKAGVRSASSAGRAKAGELCAPWIARSPSDLAGKAFAAFAPTFSPSTVALCTRQ